LFLFTPLYSGGRRTRALVSCARMSVAMAATANPPPPTRAIRCPGRLGIPFLFSGSPWRAFIIVTLRCFIGGPRAGGIG